jgi:hypothetical protein
VSLVAAGAGEGSKRRVGEKKVRKKKIKFRWVLVGWKFQLLSIFHEIDRKPRRRQPQSEIHREQDVCYV